MGRVRSRPDPSSSGRRTMELVRGRIRLRANGTTDARHLDSMVPFIIRPTNTTDFSGTSSTSSFNPAVGRSASTDVKVPVDAGSLP